MGSGCEVGVPTGVYLLLSPKFAGQQTAAMLADPLGWDYVVMQDQSETPGGGCDTDSGLSKGAGHALSVEVHTLTTALTTTLPTTLTTLPTTVIGPSSRKSADHPLSVQVHTPTAALTTARTTTLTTLLTTVIGPSSRKSTNHALSVQVRTLTAHLQPP